MINFKGLSTSPHYLHLVKLGYRSRPVLLSVEANPENSLKVVHRTEIDDFYFSWRPNHFSEKLRCLQFMWQALLHRIRFLEIVERRLQCLFEGEHFGD